MYSQTYVQRPPMGPQNNDRCWQVVVIQRSFLLQMSNLRPQNGGCYRQVVVSSGMTVSIF